MQQGRLDSLKTGISRKNNNLNLGNALPLICRSQSNLHVFDNTQVKQFERIDIVCYKDRYFIEAQNGKI